MQTVLATVLQQAQPQPLQSFYANNATIWGHMSDALHQSLYRVLSLLIAILPGILAFFTAVAACILIGLALSVLLRRGLTTAKFDERLAHGRGNVDWAPSASPTVLVARTCFWACVLLGLTIGASAFDAAYATATTLPNSLLPYLTRVVGAVFLFIAGTLAARYLARSVLIEAVNAQLHYARFLSLGIKWLTLVFTAATVLDHLQIGGHVAVLAFGILFGGIVLTLALAVGLGSRDLVSRSLESHVEHPNESGFATPTSPTVGANDTIRHF